MKQLAIILMATLLVQCTQITQPGPGEYIYWVNSLKVPCTAVNPTHCLQVQKADIPDPTQWESFYSSISGFEFEAGYIYKLIVKERELDAASVPADGSSIAYTLVEVLEKTKDNRLVLNDIWVLEILNGNPVDQGNISEQSQLPELEIHVGEMKYHGTDGCNNIFGGILELTESTLRFGVGAGTRMMCQNMDIPDEFNRTLTVVDNYKVQDLKLHLFDKEGKELMQFKKID
jgi:heat shock protein HslJ